MLVIMIIFLLILVLSYGLLPFKLRGCKVSSRQRLQDGHWKDIIAEKVNLYSDLVHDRLRDINSFSALHQDQNTLTILGILLVPIASSVLAGKAAVSARNLTMTTDDAGNSLSINHPSAEDILDKLEADVKAQKNELQSLYADVSLFAVTSIDRDVETHEQEVRKNLPEDIIKTVPGGVTQLTRGSWTKQQLLDACREVGVQGVESGRWTKSQLEALLDGQKVNLQPTSRPGRKLT